MSDAPHEIWHQWVARQVKTEPKKAAALTALVLMMAVLWGRIFLFGEKATSPADARATAVPSALPGSPEAQLSASPSRRALDDWKNKPMPVVRRNIFDVRLDYFPRSGAGLPLAQETGDGFWDQVGKSLASKADQEKARHILVGNLQLQASKLELKSTFMSNGKPKAIISGSLVGEGDTVEGFLLVKIEAKRIIVEREGVKLEVLFNFGQ